jgi:hypothetical protein
MKNPIVQPTNSMSSIHVSRSRLSLPALPLAAGLPNSWRRLPSQHQGEIKES